MSVPPPSLVTQRLYLEDARRKTALANVTAHRAGGFVLDRSIYHAASRAYHHAQPCDRGHLLAEGHKLKIHKVGWEHGGTLVHRTHGPMPAPGAKATLHLDVERRDEQARAHTVMHLLVAAVLDERAELLAMPEVVGGGQVNVHARFRDAAPEAGIERVRRRVEAALAQRVDVVASWAPRDEAARAVTHHPVALGAVAPDEPTLRLVRIGDACCLPCDAPLVTNTREVGRVVMGAPRPAREGVRWQARVLAPA